MSLERHDYGRFPQAQRWRATHACGGIPLAPDELMVLDGGGNPDDAQVGVAAAVLSRLTARQRLVSVWMTAGFSDEDIANHLGLTRRQLAAEFAEITQVVRRREL